MAKAHFLKAWKVIEPGTAEAPSGAIFEISDDGSDKVSIDYGDGFASTYPSAQSGTYDSENDEVVANFSETQRITFRFHENNGTPDYDQLEASVEEMFVGGLTAGPEVGEWGAEADAG